MSTKIIFKSEDEKTFWEYWQKYIDINKASSRYLKASLDYVVMLSKTNKSFFKDESFVCTVNNQPAACVFLPIEKKDGLFTVSSSNDGYVDAPLVSDQLVEKEIFKLIDEIANKNKIAKIMFSINPLENDAKPYNHLQKYGYFDTSIIKYVIDLKNTENLLKSCRKGHRSDIKDMINNPDFETFFITEENPDYKIHEEYRNLQYKCAGRVTKSKELFDIQFEKIKQGNSLLVGLKYHGKNIAFSFFEYNNGKVIYSSTADDPEYDHFHLYHILVFKAMEYFKEIGASHIDTGQPSCPSRQFDYYPDAKQLNIAFFKRGFGGDFMNQFRGIKYYSTTAFQKDLTKFSKEYISE